MIAGLFGSGDLYKTTVDETETEKLRRELHEANTEIERLRRKLGSNHPDGIKTSALFG